MNDLCPRNIKPSVLEKLDPYVQQWWHKIFRMLEDDCFLPPAYRKEIIDAIFPTKVSQKIFKILTMVKDPARYKSIGKHERHYFFDSDVRRKELEPENSAMTLKGKKLVHAMIKSRPKTSKYSSTKVTTENGDADDALKRIISDSSLSPQTDTEYSSGIHELTHEDDDKSQTKSSQKTKKSLGQEPEVRKHTTKSYNPYLKFFKANEDRVAIWRVLPPLTMEEMNLPQKAEAIATKIAEDFIAWLTNMGGAEKATMDVEGVIKMFEIGFNTHAATSLCVKVREMPCVPPVVAKANHLPQFGKRETLRRHVMKDIEASKVLPRIRGFNTILPEDLIYLPPSAQQAERWMKCNVVPQELATMQKVWEGRTQLRSVRAFCLYLIGHQKIRRPKYLIDENMFDEQFLRQPRYSVESFGSANETFEADILFKNKENILDENRTEPTGNF